MQMMNSDTRGRMLRNVRLNRVIAHFFFTSGVHYWEVYIARTDKRKSMVIGAAPSEDFESETLNGPMGSWVGGAVGYTAYGAIIQNGVEVCTVEGFGDGDIVGVQLNLNTRTIAFFRNGKRVVTREDDTKAARSDWVRARRLGTLVNTKETTSGGCIKSVGPIKFTPRTMFAAVTFAPASDDMDIYAAPMPI